jgi:hypothetical protein
MIKQRWILVSLLLSSLFALGGCRSAIGHASSGGVYHIPSSPTRLWLDPDDLGDDARLSAHWQAENDHSGAAPKYFQGTRPGYPTPVIPRSSRDVVSDEDLRPFDPIAARSTLSAVDVSACSTGKRVYGHVQVVFNPDGVVTKVIVDSPSNLTADQVKCVGDRFGTTKVSAFKGSNITMGATFVM